METLHIITFVLFTLNFSYACDSKHYGGNCKQNCSLHCKEASSRTTGTGYNCTEGRYGEWCNKTCGGGCVFGCDRFNGSCKCKLGWEGNGCEECDSKHYGTHCTLECSPYCEEGCLRETGTCFSCIDKKYGEWCNKTCGAGCVSGCDQFNGTCACKLGWKGDGCEECDSKHHGKYCTLNCSQYCIEGCSRKTGSCYNCTEGRYGDSCNETCGVGCVSGCDQSNGTCTSCKPGWEGDRCDVQSTQNAGNVIYQSLPFIIIFPAVFSIGFFLVIRQCRRKQCIRQIQQSKNTEENPGNQPSDPLESLDVIYENVRGEYEYQEFSPFSEPSHNYQLYTFQNQTDSYESMRKGFEDQELDQDSEHSCYEPMSVTKTCRGLDKEKIPREPFHYHQLNPCQNQTDKSLELNDDSYENMKKGFEDQELDQHSEHSYYEPISFAKTE